METKFWIVNPDSPDLNLIAQAAALIRQGKLVAFPTETVYGLGANGLDPGAVAGIYQAKGRPSDNPLILHVASRQMARQLSSGLPKMAELLMKKFWPGPLTLVVPKAAQVPDRVTGALPTVAIRMPSHPVARELIKSAGVPIAAPSANRSGRPSTTTAVHVWEDLAGRIDAVLDGGPAGFGVESTVLDVSGEIPTILRPGGVTREQLAAALGEVRVDPVVLARQPQEALRPRSPGMKYRHYAPKAPVFLFEGDPLAVLGAIQAEADTSLQEGMKVGILATAENAPFYKNVQYVLVVGSRREPESVAANLFDVLRSFDRTDVDIILAEGLAEEGLGLAVMNRLRKAAGYRIKNVT